MAKRCAHPRVAVALTLSIALLVGNVQALQDTFKAFVNEQNTLKASRMRSISASVDGNGDVAHVAEQARGMMKTLEATIDENGNVESHMQGQELQAAMSDAEAATANDKANEVVDFASDQDRSMRKQATDQALRPASHAETTAAGVQSLIVRLEEYSRSAAKDMNGRIIGGCLLAFLVVACICGRLLFRPATTGRFSAEHESKKDSANAPLMSPTASTASTSQPVSKFVTSAAKKVQETSVWKKGQEIYEEHVADHISNLVNNDEDDDDDEDALPMDATITARGGYASRRTKAKPQDMQATSSITSMPQKDVTSGGYASSRRSGKKSTGGSQDPTNPDMADVDAEDLDAIFEEDEPARDRVKYRDEK